MNYLKDRVLSWRERERVFLSIYWFAPHLPTQLELGQAQGRSREFSLAFLDGCQGPEHCSHPLVLLGSTSKKLGFQSGTVRWNVSIAGSSFHHSAQSSTPVPAFEDSYFLPWIGAVAIFLYLPKVKGHFRLGLMGDPHFTYFSPWDHEHVFKNQKAFAAYSF